MSDLVYTCTLEINQLNSTENGVISVFSRQKYGTRIILTIFIYSQSFFHFLSAKDINSCPK